MRNAITEFGRKKEWQQTRVQQATKHDIRHKRHRMVWNRSAAWRKWRDVTKEHTGDDITKEHSIFLKGKQFAERNVTMPDLDPQHVHTLIETRDTNPAKYMSMKYNQSQSSKWQCFVVTLSRRILTEMWADRKTEARDNTGILKENNIRLKIGSRLLISHAVFTVYLSFERSKFELCCHWST